MYYFEHVYSIYNPPIHLIRLSTLPSFFGGGGGGGGGHFLLLDGVPLSLTFGTFVYGHMNSKIYSLFEVFQVLAAV